MNMIPSCSMQRAWLSGPVAMFPIKIQMAAKSLPRKRHAIARVSDILRRRYITATKT